MQKVSRLTGAPTLANIISKVNDLCDGTQQETEGIADAYTVTVPSGFLPVRTLDLTQSLTSAQVASVLATLILDLKARGVNRKQGNV